ncbi:MAG: RNA polymerase subunit sigma-70 [Planctomycetaceae bacterium]|nr:RNA polymerase subunit sigma-70 [Planctomycetaceae bacterium]
MDETTITVDKVEQLLADLRAGRSEARGELIEAACDRLTALTKSIKRSFPQVGRWEQTEDVFQNASLRFYTALADVEINDARHFFRLAALQIRRELLDAARRFNGPMGLNRNHQSQPQNQGDESRLTPVEAVETTNDPQAVAEWAEFHEAIDKLPEREREVTELIWYHGMSQQDAAEALEVDERTVRRRWRSARLALSQLLVGVMPAM